MRLFIAIDLPDDLKLELGRLRMDLPGVRWVPASQIHLTLSFLGEVQETSVDCLVQELSRIQLPDFSLCFGGTGCFPDHHRPRVLWIGLKSQPYLYLLAARVREAVQACAIPLEERPFSPHITLARIKTIPIHGLNAFFAQKKQLEHPLYCVREFTLFQSRLTRQGAEHIPLHRFSLLGVPGAKPLVECHAVDLVNTRN